MAGEQWLQIPDDVLDLGKTQQQAEEWAQQQRQKLADAWAQTQRNALSLVQNQWKQDAGKITGGLQQAESDVGSTANQAVSTASNAVSTASDALTNAVREGMSHVGVYVPPSPTSVVDPVQEAQMQQRANPQGASDATAPADKTQFNPLSTASTTISTAENATAQGLATLQGKTAPPPPANTWQDFGKTYVNTGANPAFDTSKPVDQRFAAFNQEFGGTVTGMASPLEPEAEAAGKALGSAVSTVSQNPELQRLSEMLQRETPTADYLQSPSFVDRVSTDLTRAWTDAGVDINHIQEQTAKVAGRALNAEEQVAEMRLLNPNSAAQLNVQQHLLPAIKAVGPQDQENLSKYLILQHNVEVATESGEKARQEILSKPLTNLPAKDQLDTLNRRLRAYQNLAKQSDTHQAKYTPLISRTQKAIARAQERLSKQTARAQTVQNISGQMAATKTATNRQFSAGLHLDTSVQALQDLEQEVGPQRWATIQQAGQQVTDFGKSLLQKRVDAGIITQDLADELMQRYPNYVPMRILTYTLDPEQQGMNQSARTLSMRDIGLKRLTQEGTDAAQQDPLAAMVVQAYQTEAAALRNRVFNGIAQLREANPALKDVFKEVINPVTEQPTNTVKRTRELVSVQGFVDGQRTTYLMPRDLSEAIQGTTSSPVPAVQSFMTLLRSLYASDNPLFVGTHAAITFVPSLVRMSMHEGGPSAIPRVLGALGTEYARIFQDMANGNFAAGRYGSDAERFIAGGGAMFGGKAPYSLEDAKKIVTEVNSPTDARTAIKSLFSATGNLINRVDLAPRVAAFKMAEQRGANPVAAVTEGRRISTDFAMGGNVARQVNQFIPFFNVGVQATAQGYRTIKEDPVKWLKVATAVIGGPTIAAEAWNRADPQRAQDYEDVPDYYKDTGIVIMTGGSVTDPAGNRRPTFIHIPLRIYAPFASITRKIAGSVMGGKTEDWASLLGGGIQEMSPGVGLPLGAASNVAIAGMTGVNPYTGGHVVSKAADQDSGIIAKDTAAAYNAVNNAVGRYPGTHPSEIQFGLNSLGGPGRVLGSIGAPKGSGQTLVPFVRNAAGQGLAEARNARVGPKTRALMQQVGINDLAPAGNAIHNLPLTIKEEQGYQELTNAVLEQVVPRLEANKSFQQANDATKKAVFQQVVSRVRTSVGDAYLGQLVKQEGLPTIRQRIIAARQQP